MESEEARQALLEAKRAEAARWTFTPPTPRWYPLAVGAMAASWATAVGVLDPGSFTWSGMVVLTIAFNAWYDRHRGGVWPKGIPPREFWPAHAVQFACAVALIGGAYALAQVSLVAAVVVVGVGFAVLQAWYERAYAATARRMRARLA